MYCPALPVPPLCLPLPLLPYHKKNLFFPYCESLIDYLPYMLVHYCTYIIHDDIIDKLHFEGCVIHGSSSTINSIRVQLTDTSV